MKYLIKRLSVVTIVVIIFVSLTGCSSNSKSAQTADNTKQSAQSNKPKSSQPSVNQDTKKTEQLKEEKAVSNGQVYVQGDWAIAAMIIKDKISENDIKALADKYAKELKDTYKDKKINVQAVQDGKNVANVTIEK